MRSYCALGLSSSYSVHVTTTSQQYPLLLVPFQRSPNLRQVQGISNIYKSYTCSSSFLKARQRDNFHDDHVSFENSPHIVPIKDNFSSMLVVDEIDISDDVNNNPLEFATSYHAPVMAKECIMALLQNTNNIDFSSSFVLQDTTTTSTGLLLLSENQKRKLKYSKMKQKQDYKEDETWINNHSSRSSSSRSDNDTTASSMSTTTKTPPQRPRLFIDGTLGGGGHSHFLLQSLHPKDIVIGCDVDKDALTTASSRLVSYMEGNSSLPLFIPIQSNFRDLVEKLSNLKHPITGQYILSSSSQSMRRNQNTTTTTTTLTNHLRNNNHNNNTILFPHGADGLLLDLGVSSYQIDNPQRGFTYNRDGPLDMRMSSDTLTLTAADICNEFSVEQLIDIFRRYGDEPRSKAIAQSIIQRRPLLSTMDLVNAISDVTPSFSKISRRMGRIATCARVFQSLRIVVNQEEEALQQVLLQVAPTLVRPGDGRLVVLTYHSLEDRAVKRAIRDGDITTTSSDQKISSTSKLQSSRESRDIFGNIIMDNHKKPWSVVGKKIKASDDEVKINSRARSATLRVATRRLVS